MTTHRRSISLASLINNFKINLRGAEGLFHVSEKDLDGDTLYPRVPDNYLVRNGYEDRVTRRVSFSKTVSGALRGLSADIKGKVFNVYSPTQSPTVVIPSIEQVPDVQITEEIWVVERVTIKKVGVIVVGDATQTSYKYNYGDQTAELWDWNWEQIE